MKENSRKKVVEVFYNRDSKEPDCCAVGLEGKINAYDVAIIIKYVVGAFLFKGVKPADQERVEAYILDTLKKEIMENPVKYKKLGDGE